jgi:hypothetical protein
MWASSWKTRCRINRSNNPELLFSERHCRRNTFETIAKPNRHEPFEISGRPNIEQEMTMIKVGSKEEVALLLALFGVLNLPLQAPKRRK